MDLRKRMGEIIKALERNEKPKSIHLSAPDLRNLEPNFRVDHIGLNQAWRSVK